MNSGRGIVANHVMLPLPELGMILNKDCNQGNSICPSIFGAQVFVVKNAHRHHRHNPQRRQAGRKLRTIFSADLLHVLQKYRGDAGKRRIPFTGELKELVVHSGLRRTASFSSWPPASWCA